MALCTAMNTLVFSLVEYCLMMLVAVVAWRSVVAQLRLCARGAVFRVVECMIGGTFTIQEMPSTMNTGVDEVLSCGWLDGLMMRESDEVGEREVGSGENEFKSLARLKLTHMGS
jgi:hypothetical protein